MNEELKFDFDFEGADSSQMLDLAKHELITLKGSMSVGEKEVSADEIRKTEEYFNALKSGKLKFPRAEPTVFPLNPDHFKQNDLPTPKNFQALSAQARFYWVEAPLLLIPGEKPFYKLQMSMEFDKDVKDSQKIPKVHSVFPETKFVERAKIEGKIDLGLGEDLKFKVVAGIDDVALPQSIPIVEASAGGKLGVSAKAASTFGIVAGPFSLTSKRALVTCRFAGEQALWTITDEETLQENNPIFIVVLEVPMDVAQVRMTAYAQAHRSAPLPQFIVRLLGKLSPKSAEWLKKGSPEPAPPCSYLIKTL